MTGLQAKVLFPTVYGLTQFSDYISLLKAELILKPVPGSYNPLLPLPPRLIASDNKPDKPNRRNACNIRKFHSIWQFDNRLYNWC